MQVPAIRFTQKGQELYITRLSGEVLSDESKIKADIRTDKHLQGYQRVRSESRIREFSKFLRSEGEYEGVLPICPNNIVLNVRDKKPLFIDENGLGIGVLDLTDVELWEVDGQHRIGGFQNAIRQDPELRDFLFPAVIMNVNKLDEAATFYLVNTKQQRVSTDLCQRILTENLDKSALGQALVAQGKDWMKRGLEIIDGLNRTPDQPWFKKIKTPGGEAESQSRFMSQNGFLQSLRPLLTSEPYKSMGVNDLVKLLTRYWNAIETLVPECFVEGKQKHYVLQKTTGVPSMHSIAPTVFERARRMAPIIEERNLKALLAHVLVDGHDYWGRNTEDGAAAYGSSNKSIRILTARLLAKLPPADSSPLV